MSASFNTGKITNTCAFKQRKAGIVMPQCPPSNEIEINGPRDYFFWANFSRESYKTTYDSLFDLNSEGGLS